MAGRVPYARGPAGGNLPAPWIVRVSTSTWVPPRFLSSSPDDPEPPLRSALRSCPRVRLATALAVTALAAAACGGVGATTDGDRPSDASPAGAGGAERASDAGPAARTDSSLLADLCATRDLAATPAQARVRFYDRAHGPLHVLADRVAEVDREAAGRLLRSKQAVEQTLGSDPVDPGPLREHVDRLVTDTAAALGAANREATPC